MNQKRHKLADLVDARQERGIYYFTRTAALNELNMGKQAFDRALMRLSKKKRVVSVYRGFYLIIPVEYKSWGVLPADWFIADLMKYLKQPVISAVHM